MTNKQAPNTAIIQVHITPYRTPPFVTISPPLFKDSPPFTDICTSSSQGASMALLYVCPDDFPLLLIFVAPSNDADTVSFLLCCDSDAVDADFDPFFFLDPDDAFDSLDD
eukprot:115629_1